ncbi:MAG: GNAT superfamily N-acetyltransferase [Pseudohongiellaceae bacterium]|jgi:GNAT superfamily N-acetyltransferase
MSELNCKLPDIKVTKPNGLSSRLFFQVFSGPNAIAFAQLSSHSHNRRRRLVNDDSQREVSLVLGVSYCLKNIEVSPHYRNQGIGSALLKEVIGFCRDERVKFLYGKAKGDLGVLRKWYTEEGFDLDAVDNIQLQLV